MTDQPQLPPPSQPPSQPPSNAPSKAQARADAKARVVAEQAERRRRRIVWQVVTAAVVLVLAVGGTVLLLQRQDDRDATTARDGQGAAADGATDAGGTSGGAASPSGTPAQVTADGGFVVGDPDARVTVQVVEDFQCPVCQAFEAASGSLLEQYAASGDVKVEYRGIAFLDRASSTEYSTRALNASACVMDYGTDVWQTFHRQMFLQQPEEGGDGLPDEQLVSIATSSGADPDVASCIDNQPYRAWTASTTNAAFDDGVTGTPTLFVDGKQLGSFDGAALRAAVEQALGS